ncbi:uncharacterized protein PGTG_06316 [Puccinia graminis f. sp. tritici CRL 75-36-700-3]|uniref:Uncharacterized protein n=1 Tax=Puccinia graminis f. sp. tritici (strain CRL 75-36-700-3 / race SCCL) TaxID=418459 RepID=E3K7R2_PUCGT|nr:uncharacterized protein PGTG_06316 [Puccinia graminis f. sp. tritici CRL 75-36-700-3]EFP80360.1 hypothetical protein PGTG_06316 [Puccinia graminis f. sp. tritici CRL 75-36-700-3]
MRSVSGVVAEFCYATLIANSNSAALRYTNCYGCLTLLACSDNLVVKIMILYGRWDWMQDPLNEQPASICRIFESELDTTTFHAISQWKRDAVTATQLLTPGG